MTNVKQISVAFLFAAVLLVPGGAFAGTMPNEIEETTNNDYRDGNKLEPDFEDLPHPMAENIETNETTLKAAHEKITMMMIIQNDVENYDDNEYYIPYTATYIDGDNLVVGIDPAVLDIDWPIYEQDIVDALGTDVPVQIQYMVFEPESDGFFPVEELPTEGARGSAKTGHPCDSPRSLHCYYFKKIESKCDSGKFTGRSATFKNVLVRAGWDIGALCNNPGVTQSDIIENINARINGNMILLTWDRITEPLKKLYVYTYKDGRYIDRDVVRNNLFMLRNFDDSSQYQFKIVAFPSSGGSETKWSDKVKTASPENYNPSIKAKKLSNGDIKVTWTKPDALKRQEIQIWKDYRKISTIPLSKSDTSYTFTNEQPGSKYQFKLDVDYTKRTKQYGKSEVFNTPYITIPLVCAADQVARGNQCVDRCPASNEEWRGNSCVVVSCPYGQMIQKNRCVDRCPAGNEEWQNNMCVVTSCPTGQVIKNNECVDKPKPKPPVVNQTSITPPVTNQTSMMPTNSTSTIDRSTDDAKKCPQVDSRTSTPHSGESCPVTEQRPTTVLTGNNDLLGGSKIKAFSNNPLYVTGGGHGTAGLVVNHNGNNAVLTASHVVDLIPPLRVLSLDTEDFIKPEIGSEVLATTNVGSNTRGVSSDAILIRITSDAVTPHLNKIQTTDGVLDVTSFGGAPDMDVGSKVEIYARHNQGVGYITHQDVTVQITPKTPFATPYVLTDQIAATYPSQEGDSGGPIFQDHDNGTAAMLGIAVAASCEITYGANNASASSRDDYNNCFKNFKIFSPWENIANDLGIN